MQLFCTHAASLRVGVLMMDTGVSPCSGWCRYIINRKTEITNPAYAVDLGAQAFVVLQYIVPHALTPSHGANPTCAWFYQVSESLGAASPTLCPEQYHSASRSCGDGSKCCHGTPACNRGTVSDHWVRNALRDKQYAVCSAGSHSPPRVCSFQANDFYSAVNSLFSLIFVMCFL